MAQFLRAEVQFWYQIGVDVTFRSLFIPGRQDDQNTAILALGNFYFYSVHLVG